eukprot:CAMPEP_0203844992 /NCGR_PEP_ID=MMETSP0359-20131031/3552_1 /ASSEMBLY_ACC=CAM_ASM_000338 /TAXON_ID=268821 /ORGANISM="Scrippsiella Hangoei, Strain SHTV-5" /LENGTH=30 /DNA_ID= /DNA_START= /DNA_END= /DNA_ORIENTATION=
MTDEHSGEDVDVMTGGKVKLMAEICSQTMA